MNEQTLQWLQLHNDRMMVYKAEKVENEDKPLFDYYNRAPTNSSIQSGKQVLFLTMMPTLFPYF